MEASTFIVIYELGEGPDLNGLLEKLKSYNGWAKITASSWAVGFNGKADEIRNDLEQYIGEGGRIFVLKSGKAAAWRNIIARNEWFKKNL